MNELLGQDADPAWEAVAPLIDDALDELGAADREVVLLRYFERKTAREIAALVGGSEESVHKRAQRALERLREVFARRDLAAGAGGLATLISTHAVQAAPAGLSALFTAAALSEIAAPTAAVFTATKTIAMTTAQKLVFTAALSVLAGAVTYEAHQAASLRDRNRDLLERQAPLEERLNQLQRERTQVGLEATLAPPVAERGDQHELLQLRGEVAVLRQQANAANEKARAAEQKLSAELSASQRFSAHQTETINAAKQVGLAMRIWSLDNNGLFPTSIVQMTNELALRPDASGNVSFKIGNIDLFSFEFPNVNGLVQDHPNAVAGRERLARQSPDGTWQRIYLFADGSVQTASSFNGDFTGWEKANTYIPPADQASSLRSPENESGVQP